MADPGAGTRLFAPRRVLVGVLVLLLGFALARAARNRAVAANRRRYGHIVDGAHGPGGHAH